MAKICYVERKFADKTVHAAKTVRFGTLLAPAQVAVKAQLVVRTRGN